MIFPCLSKQWNLPTKIRPSSTPTLNLRYKSLRALFTKGLGDPPPPKTSCKLTAIFINSSLGSLECTSICSEYSSLKEQASSSRIESIRSCLRPPPLTFPSLFPVLERLLRRSRFLSASGSLRSSRSASFFPVDEGFAATVGCESPLV
ncbi:hypothetical protein Mapa_012333 [Marchantia paleacea]|nr:hypothetical protein Mapa_012333 [Marchantia paleacea]